jgi:O-antigen ligase
VSPIAAKIQAEAFGPGAPDGDAWLRQIEDAARRMVPEAADAPRPASPLTVGAEAPAPPRWFRLSLDPEGTLERAFWYVALILAFLLTVARTADPRRAAVYQSVLFTFFGTLALVGLANYVAAPGSILWLIPAPEATRPMGPYVNPSHFAGVMELAIPWMLGYGLAPFAHRQAREPFGPARIGAVCGVVVALAASLVAASKTAALTIGVTSAAVIVVAARRGRHGRKLLLGSVGVAVVLVAVAIAGPLRGRFADFLAVSHGDVTANDRATMWKVGAALAADYPLAGSGFGAFHQVVPRYLPLGESGHWAQLHNDYLEVLVAGGLVACVLVAWLAIAYAIRLTRAVGIEARAGRSLPALGLALGVASLAVHEIVDFNLQIPANALLFVVTAACGLAPLARSGDLG